MNKMKKVAELLGVQLGERFKIKDLKREYYIDEYGLKNDKGLSCVTTLTSLLNGELEIVKPILDDGEKKYLENALRPFRDRVESIWKNERFYNDCEEHITINFKMDAYCMNFPYFRKDSMYKGMEVNKHYTLKELGLFEDGRKF